MHFQLVGDGAGGEPFQAQENALDAQQQAGSLFSLSFPPNRHELLNRPVIAFGKYRVHICPVKIDSRLVIVELFMRVYIE